MTRQSCGLSWFLGRLGCWPTATAILLLCSARALAGQTLVLPPLTTVSGSPRLPGKFVWADLVTDDVPAARKFYAQLFGWRFWDMGNYTIALNDDRPLWACSSVHGRRTAPRSLGGLVIYDEADGMAAALRSGQNHSPCKQS
jgi:hypothetical protein